VTPETAICNRLVADAAVAALIVANGEERIYPSVLPQKPTLPALVYFRASSLPKGLTRTSVGPISPRVQIDAYASAYADADALADAVLDALHGKAWRTDDGDVVQLVVHEGDNDAAPQPDAGIAPGTKLYRRSADYRITFRKAG
jgi:hypothetical protein